MATFLLASDESFFWKRILVCILSVPSEVPELVVVYSHTKLPHLEQSTTTMREREIETTKRIYPYHGPG